MFFVSCFVIIVYFTGGHLLNVQVTYYHHKEVLKYIVTLELLSDVIENGILLYVPL